MTHSYEELFYVLKAFRPTFLEILQQKRTQQLLALNRKLHFAEEEKFFALILIILNINESNFQQK
jgi:hypothetical protein